MATKLETIPLGEKQGLTAQNYAKCAQSFMKKAEQDYKGLTTSKLRNIYGLIINLSSRIDEDNFREAKSELQYLKVKMAYESGRDDDVKKFISTTKLMDFIDEIDTYGKFLTYCRYLESIVAYFKYYGGRD